MTIFHYDALPVNANFGAGLNVPAIHAPLNPGRKGFTVLDAAFEAGRSAALESVFSDVLPPASYTAAEAEAFKAGATEGYRELEWEMEEARRATATTWEEFEPMLSAEGHGGFLGHDA